MSQDTKDDPTPADTAATMILMTSSLLFTPVQSGLVYQQQPGQTSAVDANSLPQTSPTAVTSAQEGHSSHVSGSVFTGCRTVEGSLTCTVLRASCCHVQRRISDCQMIKLPSAMRSGLWQTSSTEQPCIPGEGLLVTDQASTSHQPSADAVTHLPTLVLHQPTHILTKVEDNTIICCWVTLAGQESQVFSL